MRDGVSNHQPHDCLLNGLFRRRSKKTSKLRVTGLFEGNSPVTGEFPAQKASNAENISIWWHHHHDDDEIFTQAIVKCQLYCSFRFHEIDQKIFPFFNQPGSWHLPQGNRSRHTISKHLTHGCCLFSMILDEAPSMETTTPSGCWVA